MNERPDEVSTCVGLGPVRRLAASTEFMVGRWPSLVVRTTGASVQLDVDPELPAFAARELAAALIEGAAEWLAEIDAAAGRESAHRRVKS